MTLYFYLWIGYGDKYNRQIITSYYKSEVVTTKDYIRYTREVL